MGKGPYLVSLWGQEKGPLWVASLQKQLRFLHSARAG